MLALTLLQGWLCYLPSMLLPSAICRTPSSANFDPTILPTFEETPVVQFFTQSFNPLELISWQPIWGIHNHEGEEPGLRGGEIGDSASQFLACGPPETHIVTKQALLTIPIILIKQKPLTRLSTMDTTLYYHLICHLTLPPSSHGMPPKKKSPLIWVRVCRVSIGSIKY